MMVNRDNISPLDLKKLRDTEPPEMDFILPGLLAGTIGNLYCENRFYLRSAALQLIECHLTEGKIVYLTDDPIYASNIEGDLDTFSINDQCWGYCSNARLVIVDQQVPHTTNEALRLEELARYTGAGVLILSTSLDASVDYSKWCGVVDVKAGCVKIEASYASLLDPIPIHLPSP